MFSLYYLAYFVSDDDIISRAKEIITEDEIACFYPPLWFVIFTNVSRCLFYQHFMSSFLYFAKLFFYLQFVFVIDWQKNIGTKAACKKLLKLNTVCSWLSMHHWDFLSTAWGVASSGLSSVRGFRDWRPTFVKKTQNFLTWSIAEQKEFLYETKARIRALD